MEKSTQTTDPAPTVQPEPRVPTPPVDPARAAYRRASSLADGIVDQLTVLPHAIEQYEDFGGVYGIRLHFGNDLDAGCGVLEVAALADADVLRDPVASGVWVETHATIEGVNVIARALLTKDAVDALDDDPVPDTDTVPEEPAIPPPPAAEPVPLYATVLPVVPITAAIADGAK